MLIPPIFKPSDDDIPINVQLQYTPHATRARFDDPKGVVGIVPKAFRRKDCKSYTKKDSDGHYHVRYIYDQDTDLYMVINVQNGIGTVVTLWLEYCNNFGRTKGRYFLYSAKYARKRTLAVKMATVS